MTSPKNTICFLRRERKGGGARRKNQEGQPGDQVPQGKKSLLPNRLVRVEARKRGKRTGNTAGPGGKEAGLEKRKVMYKKGWGSTD